MAACGRESDRYRPRGASWTKSRAAEEELVSRDGVGDVHPARVNPEAPDEAVFVGGGPGIVVGAWRWKGAGLVGASTETRFS